MKSRIEASCTNRFVPSGSVDGRHAVVQQSDA